MDDTHVATQLIDFVLDIRIKVSRTPFASKFDDLVRERLAGGMRSNMKRDIKLGECLLITNQQGGRFQSWNYLEDTKIP